MADPTSLARFDVTAAEIDRVVAVFYGAVRRHEILGPVFAAHVTDWPEHEAKIAAFWRNAILRERSYSGNPMRVHVATPEIEPAHFGIWLALFHATLARTVSAEHAKAWGALADRIGEGFRAGVVSMRQPKNAPPRLF